MMKAFTTVVTMMAMLMLGHGACAEENSALALLAEQLHQARALPAGTPTQLACPADVTQFVGLKGSVISTRLGDPDYLMDGRDENPPQPQTTWSYFLKSPGHEQPVTSRGYAVVTLYIGNADLVERAECKLSK